MLAGILTIAILLVFSALVSGSEVALFSLNKSDLKDVNIRDSKSIKIISNLLSTPKKLLATILIANNFINIGIVLLFASLSENLLKDIDVKIDIGFIKINLIF